MEKCIMETWIMWVAIGALVLLAFLAIGGVSVVRKNKAHNQVSFEMVPTTLIFDGTADPGDNFLPKLSAKDEGPSGPIYH